MPRLSGKHKANLMVCFNVFMQGSGRNGAEAVAQYLLDLLVNKSYEEQQAEMQKWVAAAKQNNADQLDTIDEDHANRKKALGDSVADLTALHEALGSGPK